MWENVDKCPVIADPTEALLGRGGFQVLEDKENNGCSYRLLCQPLGFRT